MLATDTTKELLKNDYVEFVSEEISGDYKFIKYKVIDGKVLCGYKEVIKYTEVYLNDEFIECFISYVQIKYARNEQEFIQSIKIADEE